MASQAASSFGRHRLPLGRESKDFESGFQPSSQPASQLHCPHSHSRTWHRAGTGSNRSCSCYCSTAATATAKEPPVGELLQNRHHAHYGNELLRGAQ